MRACYAILATLSYPLIRLWLKRRVASGKEVAARLRERLGHSSIARPEGKLIVRDGNAANTRKHRLTRFTELLSTGIFSFNKTTEQLCFTSEAQIRSIAQEGGMQLEILPNDRYTSNTIYIFQKNKPEHE